MNSAELAQQLIDRAKALQQFRIMRPVPNGFDFRGRCPYDISIKNDIMTVTVYATTLEEAKRMANEFIDSWTEDC